MGVGGRTTRHRAPIPKLIYLGLLKIWPDFRVGMVFNIVVLAGVAAAFILFVSRGGEGGVRRTDAFFPVVFLNLGQWETLGWSWQLEYVVATSLACGALLLAAPGKAWTTRRALLLGTCLVGIPFCGATALLFAPLVAVGLLPRDSTAPGKTKGHLDRSCDRPRRDQRLVLHRTSPPGMRFCRALIGKPVCSPAPRSLVQVGPAAGAWWFVSFLGTGIVVGGAALLLWRRRTSETWPWLGFLAASVGLAASMGG